METVAAQAPRAAEVLRRRFEVVSRERLEEAIALAKVLCEQSKVLHEMCARTCAEADSTVALIKSSRRATTGL